MTTSIDRRGNVHRGKGAGGGQFADKRNSRPRGRLRAQAPRDLAELELGQPGEAALVAAAIGEQHVHFIADGERHDRVVELAAQIGVVQGKEVVVVDAREFPSVLDWIGRRGQPGLYVEAHGKVLVIDHATEMASVALDAIRAPLERGEFSVQSADRIERFDADFQLVLVSSPCPCGRSANDCTCSAIARRRHLGRLSGPVLDRMSVRGDFGAEPQEASRVTTDEARQRVVDARAATKRRLAGESFSRWRDAPGPWMRDSANRPGVEVTAPLDRALECGQITMRRYDAVLRVAWAFAMADGNERPDATNVHAAMAACGQRRLDAPAPPR